MEKRQIKSVEELVNAWSKGVEVQKDGFWANILPELEEWSLIRIKHFCKIGRYTYKDEVQVVELWGLPDYSGKLNYFETSKKPYFTHKQTQIHLNGAIIWTETEML